LIVFANVTYLAYLQSSTETPVARRMVCGGDAVRLPPLVLWHARMEVPAAPLHSPLGRQLLFDDPILISSRQSLQSFPQRITKLVQLGFAFLVGKQTGFDHEDEVRIEASASCHNRQGFSRCPILPPWDPLGGSA
jgi:hypothetical protein